MGLFSSIMKPINKGMSSIFGDELGQALTTAAIAALAVYSGGALAGAIGGMGGTAAGVGAGGAAGTTGAGAGTALAEASGFASSGSMTTGGVTTQLGAEVGASEIVKGAAAKMTANEAGLAALKSGYGIMGVTSGGMSGYQAGMQKKAQEKAESDAAKALREQEITRKKALLAEQTSVSKRMNAAQNVRNNLQGLSSGVLGGSKQLLGG